MDESTDCLRNSPTLGQKRKSSTDSDDATDVKKQPLQPQIDDKQKNINNLRKNIRDVLDENQLDSTTLAAQREESERLARVNEQQKIIREYQRQTAVNRQVARTQSRVLSLLQNSSTFAKVTDYSASYSPPAESCEATVSNVIESSSSNNTTNSEDPQSNFCEVPKEKIQTASEIVTIDDSSDDDCILLSDEEEIEDETEEEDANNSGMHVKDVYNVPDEKGRVIINIGHPEGEDDIFVAPQIAKTIKPHQIGGIRFLFDNIIESTKRFKSSSGFGCILAHSMGLGKTLQVVCFCDIFMRHTPSNSILCVMPINTIQNWLCEFNMWTPRVSHDTENVRPRTFEVFALNDQQKTLSARGKVILRWAKEGGVLLMGYELFRLLALKLTPTRRRRGKGASKTDIGPKDQANNNLMDEMYKALVKPGPDLVICDEGHRIKNAHAGISVALKQIRTRRRIVLTGYPLQNNLLEYWCMVDFVRPNYLGTRSEFCNMFERPIQNGQCIDSTPEDTKLMRYRAHVLHSLLMGFVQRRSHTVLQQTLPEKQEYVILTRMTSFQKQLYDTFMNDVVRTKSCPNPLKAFAVCCKIWNHPDVLYNFLKKRQADLDLEIDEVPSEEQTVQVEILNNDEANTMKSKLPNTSNTDVNSNGNEKTIQKNIPAQPTSNYEKNVQSQRSEFYGDNYFQQFSTNINGYWQDSNTQYDNDCPPMSYSSEPNYVGMVKQNFCKKIEEISPNQSEIVDLDTKEIKTVSTNMNMRRNSFNDSDDQSKKLSPTSPNEEKNEKGNPLPVVKPKSEDLNDTTKIKSDEGIPYDWATELMKNYQPGLISNSPKMEIVFYILKESIEMGDRILLFSQSLLTLNLIESFLEKNYIPNTNCFWSKNTSYCRLDGSTSAQEREKLVNEFNSNTRIKLFLISTRAGSLGINLIGANRVIIFDASWNPCHDTQAVYRVYRYGQFKSCYIYRIVMDKCLEKKIYDRQIKKQGMSNRVVDECNPESHLSLKEVTNLCHDYENEKEDAELFVQSSNVHTDVVIQKIVEQFKNLLSKEPFHHESLLVDRKEKKLSQAEKRLAHRGYEIEKKSISQKSTFSNGKMQYRIMNSDGSFQSKPLSTAVKTKNAPRTTRWIPADVWQRQGMTAQEMTLPLDVVIPTNSSDKSSIILKAGQRVMVLKSTKGIYMQLESGKIIAIRTSNKSTETVNNTSNKSEVIDITSDADNTTDSKKNPTKADNITPRTDYKQSCNTVQRTKSEDLLQNLDKSSSQNIKNTNDVLQNDKLATKPFLKDNTQNHLPPATPNALQKDQKETFWEPQSKLPESPKEQNTWKNSTKYQDEPNSAYDYLSTSTYKSDGADENRIKNMNNESLKSVSSLDRIQEHEKNPKDVLKKHDLYLSAPNKLECGNNGIRNFVDFNIDQQKDKKSNISDYSLNEEKPNAKSEEVKQHCDLDTIPTRNFPLPMNASYSHIDTLKNIDYSSFQQQPHQSLFKPTLYPPQFNSQRYPFSGMASSSQNGASILNSNSSNNINAYMPSRDINNYSTQYYDGYTTNNITDPCNYPLRYADYSSYGSYNHSLYQNNLSQAAYRSNANSSLKPYHMPWPELVTHSPSTENCSTTYPSSNYSNGSHTNHWPN